MRKRDGYTAVLPKGGGDFYLAALDQHDHILSQLRGTGTFVEFAGLYGERWTLFRAQIEGVGLVSAAAYEDATQDDREEKRDEAIEG